MSENEGIKPEAYEPLAEKLPILQPNSDNVQIKAEQPDPNYWRSFEELYRDPSIIEASYHECRSGAIDDFNPSDMSVISRRKFFALLGASAALAGAGCADYRDKGEIIPYVKKPEEITPGKATYYASTCNSCSNGCGILIKAREGRPIKVDGNPDHPVSKGKICAKGQASILNLYNPDRLHHPLKGSNGSFSKVSWEVVDSEIINELSKSGNKEIAIITGKINSPTGKKILDDFIQKFPSTKIYSYELFSEEIRNSAWKKCYGTELFPLIKWNEAKVIVALESDFLGTDGNKVENALLYSEGRDVMNLKKFNRLYVVEGNLSLTGNNSDYRIKLRPDAQFEFVMSLINEVSKKVVNNIIDSGKYSLKDFIKKFSLSEKRIKFLVDDLLKNRGSSIVYAGRTLPENVHIAVNLLNEILENQKLYRTDSSDVEFIPYASKEDWINLIASMNNGNVAAVIHYDTNPVYHLPEDFGYEEALKKVANVISLVEIENETSAKSNYVLPLNHAFESWGDTKTRTGFYSTQQPVIAPIFNSKQKEVVLLIWISGKTETNKNVVYHEYLMRNWEQSIYPTLNSKLNFREFWLASLHDGVVFASEQSAGFRNFNASSAALLNQTSQQANGYTIVLRESYAAGDGRFADNGWMQELPHPVTKITWDNYASISQKTAKKLEVKSNDIIEIKIGKRSLKIPAFIQPGTADDTITIELGYGRAKAGVVGTGVGFNANVLLSKDSTISKWIYTADDVKKSGDTYKLVTAQEHHTFDEGYIKDAPEKRKIIREGTIEEYKKNPGFLRGEKGLEFNTLYGQHFGTLYSKGVKWGMSVDLNKCLGCGECVIACNAENNIPVVGKDQVDKGREMHWIRVDRYYSGDPDDPKIHNQLMLCQHCDHAPCENVCPVVATTHSEDGLNQMTYNRCVGTRYCSNNCPYKVRRFNFFNFRDHFRDSYQQNKLLNLVNNPEVTIRSRGVMEKCTFCIQRIMEAREDAIRENRPLKGSDVKTACQEACNTNAIKFGDMNTEEETEYNTYRKHELGYYVLEDLNTRPNVTYIAKLRNTHPEEA